jgi:hypothetical protein
MALDHFESGASLAPASAVFQLPPPSHFGGFYKLLKRLAAALAQKHPPNLPACLRADLGLPPVDVEKGWWVERTTRWHGRIDHE